jgi:hypothetical protein
MARSLLLWWRPQAQLRRRISRRAAVQYDGVGSLRFVVSEDPMVCSAKGCQAEARWSLLWNNPKLHTPDRRKTWLACDQHKESLSDFLVARGFLKGVEPASAADG